MPAEWRLVKRKGAGSSGVARSLAAGGVESGTFGEVWLISAVVALVGERHTAVSACDSDYLRREGIFPFEMGVHSSTLHI